MTFQYTTKKSLHICFLFKLQLKYIVKVQRYNVTFQYKKLLNSLFKSAFIWTKVVGNLRSVYIYTSRRHPCAPSRFTYLPRPGSAYGLAHPSRTHFTTTPHPIPFSFSLPTFRKLQKFDTIQVQRRINSKLNHLYTGLRSRAFEAKGAPLLQDYSWVGLSPNRHIKSVSQSSHHKPSQNIRCVKLNKSVI